MKFLVDAQLPRRMAGWIQNAGFDAVHTLDLPNGNRTPDQEILAIADSEQRIVVTKDGDFVESFVLSGKPEKLLLVSTGNISNRDLEALFVAVIPGIAADFQSHRFVELLRTGYLVRA